jgi:hypothetical protein
MSDVRGKTWDDWVEEDLEILMSLLENVSAFASLKEVINLVTCFYS